MRVEKAVQATDELLSALAELIPQLSLNKTPPTRAELTSILEAPNTTLLLARATDANDQIAGILTLIVYRVPTGVRALIEDVVVNEKFRRRGVAKALINHAARGRRGRRLVNVEPESQRSESVVSEPRLSTAGNERVFPQP